jgi:hypothetical protein
MKKSDNEVTARPKVRNPYTDAEIINSSLSKYFKGKSDTLPLKKLEYSILAALSIYFQGHAKS